LIADEETAEAVSPVGVVGAVVSAGGGVTPDEYAMTSRMFTQYELTVVAVCT
jgi:hypothetical protein